MEEISCSLDKNNFTAGGFIDLNKAFDNLDHAVSLRKFQFLDADCVWSTRVHFRPSFVTNICE